MRARLGILLFLACLWLPLLGTLAGVTSGTDENRALADWPPLGKLSPERFESAFKDRFLARDALLRGNAWLSVHLFRTSPSEKAILGREGWIFYAQFQTLENLRGLVPFSQAELSAWRELLLARRDYLARRDIPYVLLICPDKHEIYPEYLPPGYEARLGPTRRAQLVAYLKATTDLLVADPTETLRAHKDGPSPLYFPTDTHWNDRGGYYAAAEVLRLAGTQPPPASRLSFQELPAYLGDLGSMVLTPLRYSAMPQAQTEPPFMAHESDELPEGYAIPNPDNAVARTMLYENPAGEGRLLMFRDSFGTALKPYLTNTFSRSLLLWIGHVFRPDFVTREQPDLVVQQFVGRSLVQIDPDQLKAMDNLPEE